MEALLLPAIIIKAEPIFSPAANADNGHFGRG